MTGKHFFQRIVPTEETEPFLKALDEAYYDNSKNENGKENNGGASWFAGQQVSLNIGGKLDDEWDTRKEQKDSFNQHAI